MISLCLQCCPQDLDAAFELTQLICKIEKHKRPNTEFYLIYRKDCPNWIEKEFVKLVHHSFSRCGAYPARNHDTGWPAGSNMLAASAFIEMEVLRRQGICQNEAFLLFEPDCVPLALDWIDQLSSEWDRGRSQGRQAVGHWHQQGGPETLHMNGNAIFRTDFFDKNPTTIVGCGTQGWDYWFRDRIIPISMDTYAIFQHYNRPEITLEELEKIEKHGKRPALFHGIKSRSGRQHAEELIFRLAPAAVE